jgi:hypothetical protein
VRDRLCAVLGRSPASECTGALGTAWPDVQPMAESDVETVIAATRRDKLRIPLRIHFSDSTGNGAIALPN